MSDVVVKIDMDPLVERFQPDLVELWRTGGDVRPHPNDGPKTKQVWTFCQDILNQETSTINLQQFGENVSLFAPRVVKKIIEGSDEPEIELVNLSEEEKGNKLKKLCQKQIDHFIKYRDILPAIQELLNMDDNVLETVTNNGETDDSSDKENDDVNSRKVLINMQILKRASKVKVKINKQKFLKDYVDRLPQKEPVKPHKIRKVESAEVVKKHGFADLSAEELEAKRSMKKCYFKHKFWPCRKCTGCIKPDCGVCMYCKDKSKFGGHNILKQKCIHKKCSNPVVRSCDRCQWNL